MRCVPVGISLTVVALSIAHAETIVYKNFENTANFTFAGAFGAATTSDGAILREAPNPISSGAAYLTAPVQLGPSGAFQTQFQFRVTKTPSEAIDGITFFIAKSPNGLG